MESTTQEGQLLVLVDKWHVMITYIYRDNEVTSTSKRQPDPTNSIGSQSALEVIHNTLVALINQKKFQVVQICFPTLDLIIRK